jgi:hypothetical protein
MFTQTKFSVKGEHYESVRNSIMLTGNIWERYDKKLVIWVHYAAFHIH